MEKLDPVCLLIGDDRQFSDSLAGVLSPYDEILEFLVYFEILLIGNYKK